MIVSNNRVPLLSEFRSLVDLSTLRLNEEAVKRPDYFVNRHAQLLEDDVMDALTKGAKNTPFDGTIIKISGQRFPDIVVGKYFGVEVKSSKDDKWITLGGSVNESTRVEDVKRIFLIFGKLQNPIEFRSRAYEECLSEIVVTHYPRYKIDMQLAKGETIFDKMNTSYDELRLSCDPVGKIVNYYKCQLADGESLWWTGSTEATTVAPMKIRMWRTLAVQEKRDLKNIGFALFPDLLSNSSTKYERFSLWLAATFGIVSTSMRDSFTAGGQGSICTGNMRFDNMPKVFVNIHSDSVAIAHNILSTEESLLCETWRVRKINRDRIGQWIDCVTNVCTLEHHSVRAILNTIFNR